MWKILKIMHHFFFSELESHTREWKSSMNHYHIFSQRIVYFLSLLPPKTPKTTIYMSILFIWHCLIIALDSDVWQSKVSILYVYLPPKTSVLNICHKIGLILQQTYFHENFTILPPKLCNFSVSNTVTWNGNDIKNK